jgi:hypothetical protein
MPAVYNRWNYPDILFWGRDDQGNWYIPDLVTFYFNRTFRYPYEKRFQFNRQLADHFPPRWESYWFFTEGFILAERITPGLPRLIPLKVQMMNWHVANLYDKDESGGEVIDNENNLFMVPSSEPD